MKTIIEEVKTSFDGTIIDLETIGNFCNRFNDSRRYAEIKPILFGFIGNNRLEIHCVRSNATIQKLPEIILNVLPTLKRPFYSFNAEFEMGVLSHTLKKEINFERELNIQKYEAKKSAVKELKIENYNDPFFDDGKKCHDAWSSGSIDDIIAHNRADLLKECDILTKRGSREPDGLTFVIN